MGWDADNLFLIATDKQNMHEKTESVCPFLQSSMVLPDDISTNTYFCHYVYATMAHVVQA